jgi:hypothetical protein
MGESARSKGGEREICNVWRRVGGWLKRRRQIFLSWIRGKSLHQGKFWLLVHDVWRGPDGISRGVRKAFARSGWR